MTPAGPYVLAFVGMSVVGIIVALVISDVRDRRRMRAYYRELAQITARHRKLMRGPVR